VVDLPENARQLSDKGLTTYLQGEPGARQTVRVKAVSSLAEGPKPEFVLVCVKNYSLDAACRVIAEHAPEATVVGFQNGVDNQAILPRHFAKAGFGVVGYNAWIDEPGVVGAQRRGPLVLGVLEGGPARELARLAEVLNRGVPTVVTERLTDAAYSKMIVNLANSLTTLVGHGFREISDPALFQRLMTQLAAEGIAIVRAAGHREFRMEGMPSWLLMRAAARLPLFLTRPAFNANMRKMVVSSMAQDVLQRGRTESELESLNGHFLRLAERHDVRAPYNRAIYDLCRERFGKPGFVPMDVREVWELVKAGL
jgi:2-dehydropantoate 2-reductase